MFRVHVTKDNLVFCSGHFITYAGHMCEALHGHNYRTAITIEGPLNDSWYVFDFVTIKRLMKRLVDELDHRVLLPLQNPLIQIQEKNDHVIALYKDFTYMFPKSSVILLPIKNTTAELLASYFMKRVKEEIDCKELNTLSFIELEVEESFGQSAIYREEC